MSNDTEKPFHQGTANLIPAKAGEVRNPNGRPKGSKNRSTIYREFIEQQSVKSFNKRLDAALEGCTLINPPRTIEEQIVASVVVSALQGDVGAAREVMDSVHGKIKDETKIEHSFTRMGTITANGEGGKEVTSVSLTFDVGEPTDE